MVSPNYKWGGTWLMRGEVRFCYIPEHY
uniref:Uncharacterized protein n=1 Tax=Arundo donax TaxID=35708 RepID=A0A0A9BX86_ARUDO